MICGELCNFGGAFNVSWYCASTHIALYAAYAFVEAIVVVRPSGLNLNALCIGMYMVTYANANLFPRHRWAPFPWSFLQ